MGLLPLIVLDGDVIAFGASIVRRAGHVSYTFPDASRAMAVALSSFAPGVLYPFSHIRYPSTNAINPSEVSSILFETNGQTVSSHRTKGGWASMPDERADG
jgi:hypothetical protein